MSSQIVLGLQTIASRQLDVTRAPSIITIGSVHGGVRYNIIPDEVQLEGTIRTFSPEVQDDMHRRIKLTAESIAASAGATANVVITRQNPVLFNDPALSETMLSTLQRVAGADMVSEQALVTAAEDFSLFAQRAPGLFIFLGSNRREWTRQPRRRITRRSTKWMRGAPARRSHSRQSRDRLFVPAITAGWQHTYQIIGTAPDARITVSRVMSVSPAVCAAATMRPSKGSRVKRNSSARKICSGARSSG